MSSLQAVDEAPVRDAVVAGVDGSEHSDRAVVWAAEQAALEGRRLVVVHAGCPRPGTGSGDEIALRSADLAVQRRPDLAVDRVVITDSARTALVGASRTARLVVLGSRGHGVVRSALLGSVSAAVTRHAECPVVVTRPHRPGKWTQGVLVGADGTPESHLVIELAFRLASLRDLPLTVMHTYVGDDAAEELRLVLAESVAGLTEQFPDVNVTRRVERGLVDEQLRRGRHPWSAIVVGRHPRRPLDDVLGGAVSTAVLERFDGVVVVVPQETPDLASAGRDVDRSR